MKKDPRTQGRLFAGLVLLTICGLAALGSTARKPTAKPADALDPAPDFQLTTADGKPFRLSQSQGALRVLFFIRNDGRFVAEALAMLEKILHSSPVYEKAAFLICILGSDIDKAHYEALRKQFALNWCFVKDADGAVHRLYKVIAVPTVVLVDGEGRAFRRYAGYSNAFGKEFRTDLRKVLELPELQTYADITTATRRASRLSSLGDVMVRRGIWPAALRNFESALALDPRMTSARLGAGFVHLRTGQPAEGAKYFQEVLKEDAKSSGALVGMAWTKALQGKAAEAKADLEKLRPAASETPEYHEAWAALFEAAGDAEAARKERQAADKLRGGHVNAPVSIPDPAKLPK